MGGSEKMWLVLPVVEWVQSCQGEVCGICDIWISECISQIGEKRSKDEDICKRACAVVLSRVQVCRRLARWDILVLQRSRKNTLHKEPRTFEGTHSICWKSGCAGNFKKLFEKLLSVSCSSGQACHLNMDLN